MDKIVCLVGPSGSGKTTIAKELEMMDYNIIHSYTTRKPREPNEWGHTFVDRNELVQAPFNIIAIGKRPELMIAGEELYGELYFTTKEQYKGKGTSIYTVTPKAAEQVRENVDDAEVVTIFLQCDRYVRYDRMIKDNRGLLDVINRLDSDEKVFKTCKCDYVVDANRDVDKVILDILEIIEQF